MKTSYGMDTAVITDTIDGRITVKGLKATLNNVLTCFSPISKSRDVLMPGSAANIDILIATDCISEGQNLQDCNYLVASVYALNIIDIVFADDKKVRAQWKAYYDKLCVGNPTEEDLKKIETEKCKLIEAISKSLGYKNKITWETIQNPYIPKGLSDSLMQQQQYHNGQLEVMEMMKSIFPMKSGGSSDGQNENGNP